MYLEHFGLKAMPFMLGPNTDYFCKIPGHQEALNLLLFSIRSGEGFIKITGEVGSGKTLLCRMLLEQLGEEFMTVYIPNPDLNPLGLRKALAQELGITLPQHSDNYQIFDLLTKRLIELHEQNKRTVLIIDEAQTLSSPSLEAIRLLSNVETKTQKLLQIVFFGQPELDKRLNNWDLRQLKQRISFSHRLIKLNRDELESYVCHRLSMAGYTMGSPLTPKAFQLLYRYSKGVPRLVNILCHKAMIAAYGRGQFKVDHKAMYFAIRDTESIYQNPITRLQQMLCHLRLA